MKKYILTLLLTISFYSMSTQQVIQLDELIGQFNEKSHPNYVALDSTILPVNKTGMYLQKEPLNKLIEAYHAFKAAHPNIPFVIVSATRNYTYQNGIWQRKWNSLYPKYNNATQTAADILQYSSMPGSSRHHWGTDVDITSVSSSYFQQDPKGKILYQWLVENMPKYGFCQAFNEGRDAGYLPEEWHWSYRPIAKQYIARYKYLLETQPEVIINKLNFAGHKELDLKTLLGQYVLSVNTDCY
ncbi:M15 family metallopeptidase [Zophobihabitans entericus]|uniref:M15 family metallopeptidase n=1 Tax=Zophobihabitans entericus TaxID=1635327 RepID=A0A6G9I9M2_9GAMM|nr:M15 family metallopeptidase [Zophobihabitans entericus]QIQ20529.1 M15 family metallopeptidase [Zophobihabitans entericus]